MNGAARWLSGALAALAMLGGFALYLVRGEINQVTIGLSAEMQGLAIARESLIVEWRSRFNRMDERIEAAKSPMIDADQNARLGTLREAFCAHLRNDHQRDCGLRAEPDGPDL